MGAYEAHWINDTVVDVEEHNFEQQVHSLDDVDVTYHYLGRPNFFVPPEDREEVRTRHLLSPMCLPSTWSLIA